MVPVLFNFSPIEIEREHFSGQRSNVSTPAHVFNCLHFSYVNGTGSR